MSWGRPEFLKLLWLLPLVLIVLLAVERRWWARIGLIPLGRNGSLLPGVPSRILSGLRIGLSLASAALLLASLAQPRWGFEWSEVRYSGIDIVVAIDVSKSMDAQDSPPSRLAIAKRKLTDLLQMLRGDRVGIVAFAGAAFVQCPLTVDYQAVRIFVDLLDSDLIPVGGSSLAEAVQLSVRSLTDGGADTSKSKSIILISDGEDFGAEMAESIKMAESNRISIFTLGIGTETGAPIPIEGGGFKKDAAGNMVLTRLQTDPLRTLAESTGGVYAQATIGDEDLQKIYIEPLRGKGQAGATAEREKIYHERFQWFLFGALVLMLLEWLIPPLVRRRESNRRGVQTHSAAVVLICMGLAWTTGFSLRSEALAQENDDSGAKSTEQTQLPTSDLEAFNQGVGQYRAGDFKEAEEQFKIAAQSPDPALRAKALYNLGSARAQQGRFKESAAALDEALKLEPDNQRIRDNLEFVRQQKEEQPPEQQKQDSDKSQDSNDQETQKDQEQKNQDPNQQNPSSQQPQPDSSQQPKQNNSNEKQESGQNSSGQPSPQPSAQNGVDQRQGQSESTPKPESAVASQSPQPGSSDAPALASSPGPSPGPDSGEGSQMQAGKISPQQAEQLLRSVDDKISKYLYRPEGTPKNPPKQGNKDW
jgi:Ca-activated chloride channel family protein